MLPLSTMDTTMLPTLRCPPLPPFPSLEQPLLLSLESWEPEPMLELVAMLLTLLELSMWPRGRLILIMLDMLDWDTPDMEAMEDMVLAMEVTLDMLDMEDMAMDMVLLATLSITMLPTLRCPPLPPFPSLEQPLLLSLE